MTKANPMRQRYHQIDGWRGYWIPARSVAGVSDTGDEDDSPCSSERAKAELRMLQKHLRSYGIKTHTRHSPTSNICCIKHWLTIVDPDDFPHAAQLTMDWLAAHRDDTSLIDDADLKVAGYKASVEEAVA